MKSGEFILWVICENVLAWILFAVVAFLLVLCGEEIAEQTVGLFGWTIFTFSLIFTKIIDMIFYPEKEIE